MYFISMEDFGESISVSLNKNQIKTDQEFSHIFKWEQFLESVLKTVQQSWQIIGFVGQGLSFRGQLFCKYHLRHGPFAKLLICLLVGDQASCFFVCVIKSVNWKLSDSIHKILSPSLPLIFFPPMLLQRI